MQAEAGVPIQLRGPEDDSNDEGDDDNGVKMGASEPSEGCEILVEDSQALEDADGPPDPADEIQQDVAQGSSVDVADGPTGLAAEEIHKDVAQGSSGMWQMGQPVWLQRRSTRMLTMVAPGMWQMGSVRR